MQKRAHCELMLDDALVARANDVTGILERDALVTEALRAIVARESARFLGRPGGTEPRAKLPPRHRY